MGAIFSGLTLDASGAGVGTDFSTAGFARGVLVIAGFALTGLAAGLVGFTVTFDVAMGFAFVGGRTAFFGAAAL
jgi:hypothetical protein